MPRGDRTGPMGMGPMTGRGLGYCAGYAMPGYANAGFGFGFGMGRGRGFRRAYYMTGFPGWARYGYGAYPSGFAPYPYQGAAPAVDQKEILEEQAGFLQKQLDEVREQLKNLDKTE
jgi:hypothetical protein